MLPLGIALMAGGALAVAVVSGCEFDDLGTEELKKHTSVIYGGFTSLILGALLAIAATVP